MIIMLTYVIIDIMLIRTVDLLSGFRNALSRNAAVKAEPHSTFKQITGFGTAVANTLAHKASQNRTLGVLKDYGRTAIINTLPYIGNAAAGAKSIFDSAGISKEFSEPLLNEFIFDAGDYGRKLRNDRRMSRAIRGGEAMIKSEMKGVGLKGEPHRYIEIKRERENKQKKDQKLPGGKYKLTDYNTRTNFVYNPSATIGTQPTVTKGNIYRRAIRNGQGGSPAYGQGNKGSTPGNYNSKDLAAAAPGDRQDIRETVIIIPLKSDIEKAERKARVIADNEIDLQKMYANIKSKKKKKHVEPPSERAISRKKAKAQKNERQKSRKATRAKKKLGNPYSGEMNRMVAQSRRDGKPITGAEAVRRLKNAESEIVL